MTPKNDTNHQFLKLEIKKLLSIFDPQNKFYLAKYWKFRLDLRVGFRKIFDKMRPMQQFEAHFKAYFTTFYYALAHLSPTDMYFAAVSPYFARKEGTNIKGIFYDFVDNIMKNTFFFRQIIKCTVVLGILLIALGVGLFVLFLFFREGKKFKIPLANQLGST